jgi:ADP-heptose:LPS heptosyltransferase
MTTPRTSIDALKRDCRWFRGDVPCKPHKETGCHCTEVDGRPCAQYAPRKGNILIIKLGAIGDVIRTTPLLRRLRETYPHHRFWWLTLSPEVLPGDVDVILPFNLQSLLSLQAVTFDLLINLDKDREACALTSLLAATRKQGFTLRDGKPYPVDSAAEAKYLTGVFDDLSRTNTRSYLEELFEIAGFDFRGEEYLLDNSGRDGYVWKLPRTKPVVGLNTGCGGRWVSRLWPESHWVALARQLKKAGAVPLLLGGEQEHAKNRRIAKRSGAHYLGHFPLRQFINLVDQCHCVVTAVTMAMHIAIGLRKPLVLFNNTFNRHEFELYGRGEILEPAFDCSCYYSPVCPNNCMQYLSVDTVLASCRRLLGT